MAGLARHGEMRIVVIEIYLHIADIAKIIVLTRTIHAPVGKSNQKESRKPNTVDKIPNSVAVVTTALCPRHI